jgi:acyl-CoA thioester hydrolase
MEVEPRYKFYTPIKVRFNETDLQGHVNFGQYYFYFDAAVTEYMEATGYDYQMMLADNTDFIYAESHCNYKSSARWPEILRVYTRISYIGRRSLRFEFAVWAQADDRLVVIGHIVAVTANRETFKPWPVPEGLRQAVLAYEGQLDESLTRS